MRVGYRAAHGRIAAVLQPERSENVPTAKTALPCGLVALAKVDDKNITLSAASLAQPQQPEKDYSDGVSRGRSEKRTPIRFPVCYTLASDNAGSQNASHTRGDMSCPTLAGATINYIFSNITTTMSNWLHIVLHQPEIPGNTGAVGRTCVALNAKLWLVRPLGFRIDEKTLRRAGLDYWVHLDWEVVDNWAALESRLDLSKALYFTKGARHLVYDLEFQPGAVLVFGSETQGLPASMVEAAGDRAIRIPTTDRVRSLNLASSVAITAYEAFRQLRPF